MILFAILIAGMPHTYVDSLCATVRYRQSQGEHHTWAKAWVHLSFEGVDLRRKDKREIVAYCAKHGRGEQ